jgi:hypothetical protein
MPLLLFEVLALGGSVDWGVNPALKLVLGQESGPLQLEISWD